MTIIEYLFFVLITTTIPRLHLVQFYANQRNILEDVEESVSWCFFLISLQCKSRTPKFLSRFRIGVNFFELLLFNY